jgi:hypothetical protein
VRHQIFQTFSLFRLPETLQYTNTPSATKATNHKKLHNFMIHSDDSAMSPNALSTADPAITRADLVSRTPKSGKSLLIQVQDLADQQEKLCQIREQVLINREKYSSACKRVRHQREILGRAEAKLMDAFRQRNNSLAETGSSDWAIAYNTVEYARNKLVDLEDDCLHTQDVLGAAEWELMDMETDLYQYDLQQLAVGDMDQDAFDSIEEETPTPVLPSTAKPFYNAVAPSTTTPQPTTTVLLSKTPSSIVIPPSIKVQYHIAVKKHEQLLWQFDQLRTSWGDDEQLMTASDTVIAHGLAERSGELIWNAVKSGVRVRSLQAELASKEGPIISQCYIESDGGGVQKAEPEYSNTTTSAFSDGSIRRDSDALPHKNLVTFWIYDCLRKSGMEKIHFKRILENELQLLDVTTLGITRLAGYVKRIWPSSTFNLLRRQIIASSVSESIQLVQKSLDDVHEIVSFRKKNDVDLPSTDQRTQTSTRIQQTSEDYQWFISPHRSELISIKFDDATTIAHMAAWVEEDEMEAVPTRIEMSETEKQARGIEADNQDMLIEDTNRSTFDVQHATLVRPTHKFSSNAEQPWNCNTLVTITQQIVVRKSESEYTNAIMRPELGTSIAISNGDGANFADKKSRDDYDTQPVRMSLLQDVSLPYRYEQGFSVSRENVSMHDLALELTTPPFRNNAMIDNVAEIAQLYRVKDYASFAPRGHSLCNTTELAKSHTSPGTTNSRTSLARQVLGRLKVEKFQTWMRTARTSEKAYLLHLPVADHQATGLQTMTMNKPRELYVDDAVWMSRILADLKLSGYDFRLSMELVPTGSNSDIAERSQCWVVIDDGELLRSVTLFVPWRITWILTIALRPIRLERPSKGPPLAELSSSAVDSGANLLKEVQDVSLVPSALEHHKTVAFQTQRFEVPDTIECHELDDTIASTIGPQVRIKHPNSFQKKGKRHNCISTDLAGQPGKLTIARDRGHDSEIIIFEYSGKFYQA